MRRGFGWLIVMHAAAHAYVATWSASRASAVGPALLSSIALLAYLGAVLGVLRLPVLRRSWKQLLIVGAVASLLVTVLYLPPWSVAGMVVDVGILIAVLAIHQRRIDADIAVTEASGTECMDHPRWVRAGWALGIACFGYAAAVLALRPVSLSWGSTVDERTMALPGDEVHPVNADYRIDHAITIHASASAVWPWLMQLGQDRGASKAGAST